MVRVKKGVGKRVSMPSSISPMLATLIQEPFQGEGYVHEVKWDGYRIIAYKEKNNVRLDSRSAQNYTNKYPPVVAALKKLKSDVILDGEIVVIKNGIPSFDALQKYRQQGGEISYYIFDILWKDGYDLMDLPLLERKQILANLIKENSILRYSEHFKNGPELYEKMKETGFEGIVSKRGDSIYEPGQRNYNWLKTPAKQRQEFVIGAWAESDKGRSFRSILFGAYNPKGELEWIGRSGGGYKETEMGGILKKLKALEIDKTPFANEILDTKGAIIHYVKPKLVANFEFSGFTTSGRIRKPATWLGFRTDKNPKQVVREIPKEVAGQVGASVEQPQANAINRKRTKYPYLNTNSGWRAVDKEQKNAEWQVLELDKCSIEVHNIDRNVWYNVPKARLIMYYNEVNKYLLPHIKDRPQSLNLRFYSWRDKPTFIKDMENRQPSCAKVFTDERRDKAPVRKGDKRNRIDYLVANNLETLLYMIDVGCIDINPWNSRRQAPDIPDQLWLDLDPTIPADVPDNKRKQFENNGFPKVVEAALAAKQILDQHSLTGYPKTSGKTGMHIYLPCTGLNNDQVAAFATYLTEEIHRLVPRITTLTRTVSHRGNKVYLDSQQNYYTKTLAAPYSVRPYDEPLVSTPLDWREVKPGLDRWQFNIKTIQKRLERKGDLFKDVLKKSIGIKNSKVLRRL